MRMVVDATNGAWTSLNGEIRELDGKDTSAARHGVDSALSINHFASAERRLDNFVDE